MLEDKQQILKENNLFTGLSESELMQISEHSRYKILLKNNLLFQHGQEATDFFINIEGKIKLFFLSLQGDEKVMSVINPKQSFAEAIMFLKNKQYPLNAVALTSNTTVLCINAQCYLDILGKSPEACFRIMGKLSQHLHSLVSEVNNLTLHDSTHRLVNFLLNHAYQDGELINVHLSVSKQILASQLAIQPETLSRILKNLSQEGLLKIDKNNITLIEVRRLQQLTEL